MFLLGLYVCRWENIDKNVAMPDDDLSESPPYMELSDDDDGDDSNYSPPRESGLSQCGRSLSNPFPDGRAELDRSRSSDTGGVEPRHKSPSDGNVVLSAAAGLLEERSRGRARDNGREEEETDDREALVNGGMSMYTACISEYSVYWICSRSLSYS